MEHSSHDAFASALMRRFFETTPVIVLDKDGNEVRRILPMTQPPKPPRTRRTRAEIQASQLDDLVAGLRALNPDDIVTLGQKLMAQAPRTTAALWDALSDRPEKAKTGT